jgi:hypothetical protein
MVNGDKTYLGGTGFCGGIPAALTGGVRLAHRDRLTGIGIDLMYFA